MPGRVADSTRLILDVLAAHDAHATFFILGWVAEREPDLIREIARRGHEVACHGYGHILPTSLTPAEFRDDVRRARLALEDLAGQPVRGYRAPSFSLARDQLPILAELGFQYDSSMHPFTLHDRYARFEVSGAALRPGVYRLPDGMVEVALPVERLGGMQLPISGGGYFRLYPGALFRRLVRRAISRDGHYVMYLHSWEFDPAQPRVRLGQVSRFRHYNNLDKTRARTDRLLEMLEGLGARFVTEGQFVDECLAQVDAVPGRLTAG